MWPVYVISLNWSIGLYLPKVKPNTDKGEPESKMKKKKSIFLADGNLPQRCIEWIPIFSMQNIILIDVGHLSSNVRNTVYFWKQLYLTRRFLAYKLKQLKKLQITNFFSGDSYLSGRCFPFLLKQCLEHLDKWPPIFGLFHLIVINLYLGRDFICEPLTWWACKFKCKLHSHVNLHLGWIYIKNFKTFPVE